MKKHRPFLCGVHIEPPRMRPLRLHYDVHYTHEICLSMCCADDYDASQASPCQRRAADNNAPNTVNVRHFIKKHITYLNSEEYMYREGSYACMSGTISHMWIVHV